MGSGRNGRSVVKMKGQKGRGRKLGVDGGFWDGDNGRGENALENNDE